METVIQIVVKENGDCHVGGNTNNLEKINWILDRVKLQILTAKPKEPSLIQKAQGVVK